ncbi:hypothetical protein ERO13_A08G156500v2 [Gossypium hirsutum]|nr:hypothetical protein ERO13_A08G156500v2 [Gossypium hirsutum]TYI15407.1 hypothetical protein ES332_A08G184000v1 [Gossypium tomentosum]
MGGQTKTKATMSLNCLICQHRSNSNNYREYCAKEKNCKERVGTSCSGISPTYYNEIKSDHEPTSLVIAKNKINKGHRRLKTIDSPYGATAFESDNDEPKLVRSSGVRRNWSFKDM